MAQIEGLAERGIRRHAAPILGRLVGKLVDVLPTALASLIGGVLFTQYQAAYRPAPRPAVERAAPASAEMLQLVRDEHAMILDYIKAHTAAEKSRNAAEDREDARAAVDAKSAAATVMRRPMIVSAPAASRIKAPVVIAATPLPPPSAPQAIVVAAATDSAMPAAEAPRQPGSLLARTLGIKDHVVHATLHAVSVIGGIPNWIASLGDRLGGASTPSVSRLISTS